MATPIVTIPIIGIDPVTTAISWITSGLNPFKDLVTFLCPRITMAFSNAFEIQRGTDPSIEGFIPEKEKEQALDMVDELVGVTGLSGRVTPYTSTSDSFFSEGGMTGKAVLHIPLRYLRSTGTEEKNWVLTEPEKKFFILRELGHIKFNDQAIKLVARIVIVVALILLHFHPLGWAVSLGLFAGLFIGAVIIHYKIKRDEQLRLDEFAITHLQELGEDRASVLRVAKAGLEKMRAQNLYRRESSRFGSLMITAEGDPRFEVGISLSERIKKLDKELGSTPQMLLSVV